jgi:hypothetical protein
VSVEPVTGEEWQEFMPGGALLAGDEFDEYLEQQLRRPGFTSWWHWAECRSPRRLCIDGRAYRRRQLARRRRRGR